MVGQFGRRLWYCLTPALTLMVAGCTVFSKPEAAVVWTNIPEIAAYVEQFNGFQDEHRIEIQYTDTPWRSIRESSSPPDIVVGTRLNSKTVVGEFTSLDSLINEERVDRDLFYPELYALGTVADEQLLLPLCFDLPAVMFPADSPLMEDHNMKITPQELADLSGGFNSIGTEFERLGLSVRRKPALAYELTRLFGTNYHEPPEVPVAWSRTKLSDALEFMRSWTNEINGGVATERDFAARYLFDPDYKLIREGRILFSYITAADYVTIPAEVRADLDIVWLGGSDSIPVNDDVVFVGRCGTSGNRKPAEAFVAWLFNAETQEDLIRTAQLQRMRTFGIAGGFSAIAVVNRDILTRFYPFLFGRVPGDANLDFPPPLPAEWDEMKRDVVLPWLQTALTDHEIPVDDLSEQLRQWDMQRPSL